MTTPEDNNFPSLKEWLSEAAKSNNSLFAVKKSGYRTPLWEFVRRAKRHPELRSLKSSQAMVKVEALITNQLSPLDRIWVSEFPVTSDEDARVEFLKIWEVMRFAAGETPLDAAIENARVYPVTLPWRRRTEGYTLFVSVAAWLQHIQGDKNIFLPTRKLAELLGVSEMTISRYRQWAVEDGLLDEMSKASRKDRKATEFRVILERFPLFPPYPVVPAEPDYEEQGDGTQEPDDESEPPDDANRKP